MSPERNEKVVLVTGSSSGIGRCCAERLKAAGYRVRGGVRKAIEPAPPFDTIMIDVDSCESVTAAIESLLKSEGRIDAVVNCAGFGISGAVEDTSIEEAKAQFETNFFGVVRVCRAVLPSMRERGAGVIINISSLGGLVSAPFHGLYCASKFAVEGMTEALRMETAPFGVKVVLIEPGDFKTNFTASRKKAAASGVNAAYRERFDRSLRIMEQSERQGPDPSGIAALIERIIETPDPKLRYPIGSAVQLAAPAAKKFLPWRVYEKIIMKHFEV